MTTDADRENGEQKPSSLINGFLSGLAAVGVDHLVKHSPASPMAAVVAATVGSVVDEALGHTHIIERLTNENFADPFHMALAATTDVLPVRSQALMGSHFDDYSGNYLGLIEHGNVSEATFDPAPPFLTENPSLGHVTPVENYNAPGPVVDTAHALAEGPGLDAWDPHEIINHGLQAPITPDPTFPIHSPEFFDGILCYDPISDMAIID